MLTDTKHALWLAAVFAAVVLWAGYDLGWDSPTQAQDHAEAIHRTAGR